MLGTPLISCFKASGDTVKRPGARLRAIATVCIRWVVEHVGLVGGARATGYPRTLDREIFADCPSAKIGSLENFRLYGSTCTSIHSQHPHSVFILASQTHHSTFPKPSCSPTHIS